MSQLPPLPPGATLDEPDEMPPLPPGATLDSAQEERWMPPQQPGIPEVPKLTWGNNSKEILGRLKNISVKDAAVAIGEMGLQAGSHLAGLAQGGLQGIENEINRIPQKPDRWSDEQWAEYKAKEPGTFTDTVESAVEERTYQPRTEAAEMLAGGLADTASQVSRKVTDWLPGVEETEMPLYDLAFAAGEETDSAGAAMAYTALTAATVALGEGMLKSKPKGPNRNKPKAGSDKVDAAYRRLSDEVSAYYKQADEAGGGVKSDYLDSIHGNVVQKITDEGFHPDIHPGAAAALKIIEEAAGKNHTMKGMEVTRKQLNGAMSIAIRNSADDARVTGIIRDIYDEAYVDIPDQAFIGTATNAAELYAAGRKLAHQKFKADEITWAIERAKLRAGQFTGSGFDNALKTEFRQILMNPKRRRTFNANEIQLLEAIVDGTFAQRAASAAGRFAVRGAVSGALTTGIGGLTFGPVGAIGAIALAESGRQLATQLRRSSANKAALDVIEGNTRQ